MDSADETRTAIERFHDAVNRHDVDAVIATMTEDCVFESTLPPDGDRYEGSAAIAAFFRKLFAAATERTFDIEELIVFDDRAVMRWRHRWADESGNPGHVRGVDVFRVDHRKVAEKLSYVKG